MLKDFDKDLADLDLPDEVKAQIIEKANSRSQGLVNKNSELLEKLNANKGKVQEGLSATEELAALKALQQQKELEDKQHYDSALQLNAEKFTKQIDELTGKLTNYQEKEKATLIDASIRAELKELRINPLHEDTATGFFKAQATVVDGKAMVGDKSLSDVIKDWGESDSGKASRLAPDNSGGNANGGQNVQGSGKDLSASEKRAADINKRFGKN